MGEPLTNEMVIAAALRLVFDEIGAACAAVEAETDDVEAGIREGARRCLRRIAAIRGRTLTETCEAEDSKASTPVARASSDVGPDRKLDEQGYPTPGMPGIPVPAAQPSPPAEARESRGANSTEAALRSVLRGIRLVIDAVDDAHPEELAMVASEGARTLVEAIVMAEETPSSSKAGGT